jgi:hypothetical protein
VAERLEPARRSSAEILAADPTATVGTVQPIALAALGVITVLSVALWFLGARFSRTYIAKHRARPPMTWMFRATGDPDLEGPRRLALVILPIFLVALGVYLFRP